MRSRASLVTGRLAACVNVGAPVESMYHWRGKSKQRARCRSSIKTRRALYDAVEAAIVAAHPYELPEVIAVPVIHGLAGYLDWIAAETRRLSAAALALAGVDGARRGGRRSMPTRSSCPPRAGVSVFGARAGRPHARGALLGDGRLLPVSRQDAVRARSGHDRHRRATLPPGKVKEDQFFGKVETYRGEVVVRVPLAPAPRASPLVLVADSQGCADAGVCYPATRQKVTLALPAPGKGPGPVVDAFPRKKSWFN